MELEQQILIDEVLWLESSQETVPEGTLAGGNRDLGSRIVSDNDTSLSIHLDRKRRC